MTSEFGHYWLIAAVFVILMIALNETNWNSLKFFLVFLCILSVFGFSMPLRTALALENQISQNFSERFSTDKKIELLKFKNLISKNEKFKIKVQQIEFKTRDQFTSRLDYYPGLGDGSKPWIVVIHGGGWDSGDEKQLPELNFNLAHLGYSVFSVTYRLAPKFKWPTQLNDIEDAISFLLSQEKILNLDANNWILLGRSAGAQLAGVSAYKNKKTGLKGVVMFYPPTDLTFGYQVAEENDLIDSRNLLRNLLGGAPYEKTANYDDASVMMQAQPNSVPTLLFHGDPDLLCWYKHSERLSSKLDSLGVNNYFVRLPWAQHGFDWSLNGPGGQISTSLVKLFLKSRFNK